MTAKLIYRGPSLAELQEQYPHIRTRILEFIRIYRIDPNYIPQVIARTRGMPLDLASCKIEDMKKLCSIDDIASIPEASWPTAGLNQAGVFSGNILSSAVDANKITIVPILRGNSDKGIRAYICAEAYGNVITS